jgi:hypothetical protein
MPNAVQTASKNICKITVARKTQSCVAGKAIGAYASACLPGMVENAYAAVKKDLSFWHLTM